ncbi:DUF5074 domain-containing protein [Rudanella lutea]|uniref:DUF5074 domain-containing protein n=1 Tax=Rudanella lutea TaxID=451374 RepID=UPI001FE1EB9F|nr:DUF5074 domain-containing protein [Rudanella lutea]
MNQSSFNRNSLQTSPVRTAAFPIAMALASALFVTACQTTDPEPSPYEQGVIVLNSGNFTDNNGTLSFVPRNSVTASTNIFQQANNRSLIGGMQGYTEVDGKGVILVDNSTAGQDKVEIVEVGTFKSLATLAAPDIENPRHVVQVAPNKAYISCWGATGDFSNFYPNPGYIAVVDLASRKVVKKITVSKGAERLVVNGSEVLVGSDGGEKDLYVVDVTTDEVKQKITLGNNPRPIGLDANGQLWVYSANEMIRMNAQTKAVVNRMRVGNSTAKSPSHITFGPNRQNILFVYSFYDPADGYKQKGETYSFSINDTSIPANTPYINRLFSGLGVDPRDGTIYAGVTPSYKQAGYVLRFNPTTARLIDSVRVEIAPSGFYFR